MSSPTPPPKKGKFRVYRNLHTGGWSVQQGGRVVLRVSPQDTLILDNPRPEVLRSGAARALQERRRNVHAFLTTTTPPRVESGVVMAWGEPVTYHPPHVTGLGWHYKQSKTPFEGASIAYLTEGRNVIVIP